MLFPNFYREKNTLDLITRFHYICSNIVYMVQQDSSYDTIKLRWWPLNLMRTLFSDCYIYIGDLLQVVRMIKVVIMEYIFDFTMFRYFTIYCFSNFHLPSDEVFLSVYICHTLLDYFPDRTSYIL